MKYLFRIAAVPCLSSCMLLAGTFLSAQDNPDKPKAASIEVKMIQSEEITLPAEFQIALYENLVQQLEKGGGFERVYRDGDRNVSGRRNVVVLYSVVRGFKQGSERKRQVTTVFGKTSITVHCRFTNSDGASLLERDINGKVRFFGGNLKATYDFAKKTARIARELSVPKTVAHVESQDASGNLFATAPVRP
jgi:hypothetical protein